ncbi:hypothetical protein NQ318_008272 [Aromia moschata]|uniref:Uncharacterized protein n=1 Tax=Aromia moschata TaxID=1265417 RepID=A0AAV8XYJ7_9CUCU|nr:hypothetical protein NQ318_008272 [Aromia moschata]
MTNQIVMTDEQFQYLLSGMTLALSNANRPSNFDGNFSKCASRFAGNKDEDVEAFIDAITVYKDCVNISDENAITGLPMLLDQNAGTWWQGIKATIVTWDDALTSLRHTFGFNKPPHKIFKELFSREQGDKEPRDLFVNSCRALLARLPETPELHSTHKLDMIYGLLHKRIRHRLPRDQVTSFADLIQKAKSIEDSFAENVSIQGKSKPNHESEENKASRTRSKCSFCKNFGHVQSDCRKHAVQQGKQPQTSTNQKPATTSTTFTCFGCDTSRPLIEVNIEGRHGLAYVDSGARNSIAGYKLYTHFCEMNLPYKEKSQRMVLADGQPRLVSTRIFEAIVVLQGRKIPTTLSTPIAKLF